MVTVIVSPPAGFAAVALPGYATVVILNVSAVTAVLIAGPNVVTSIGAVFGGAVVNVSVVPLTL